MRMHAARVEHTRVDVTLARFRPHSLSFFSRVISDRYGLHALPVQLYFRLYASKGSKDVYICRSPQTLERSFCHV